MTSRLARSGRRCTATDPKTKGVRVTVEAAMVMMLALFALSCGSSQRPQPAERSVATAIISRGPSAPARGPWLCDGLVITCAEPWEWTGGVLGDTRQPNVRRALLWPQGDPNAERASTTMALLRPQTAALPGRGGNPPVPPPPTPPTPVPVPQPPTNAPVSYSVTVTGNSAAIAATSPGIVGLECVAYTSAGAFGPGVVPAPNGGIDLHCHAVTKPCSGPRC